MKEIKTDWNRILNNVINTVVAWVTTAGLKVALAFFILLLSFKIIGFVARRIERYGEIGKLDKTLARTFAYIFRLALKCLIAICMIGFVGIDTSGLAALVVSFGACVGLALNGALSNLAGGILIILTRPFRVDDFIETQGYYGTVEDIHITTTKLRTVDNKVVYIPNGPLSSGTIVNYSVKDTRRVDFTFCIGYQDDLDCAKSGIMSVCLSHELVLDDPAPMVRVCEHGESSINLVVRVWVKSADYWNVKFDILEAVKLEFDKAGIHIPFRQIDVHVKND